MKTDENIQERRERGVKILMIKRNKKINKERRVQEGKGRRKGMKQERKQGRQRRAGGVTARPGEGGGEEGREREMRRP